MHHLTCVQVRDKNTKAVLHQQQCAMGVINEVQAAKLFNDVLFYSNNDLNS